MDLLSKSVEKLELVPVERQDDTEISKEVLENLLEHSSRGNNAAQFTLGQYHLSKGEEQRAVTLFQASADSGYGQALYQLAVMYYDGIGVKSDAEKGFSLMLQVAMSQAKEDRSILPAAQFNLGKAYYQGFGTKQSDQEAVKWWNLSAGDGSQDNPSSVRSMNTLALFYSRPENTDKQKVFFWHKKAALNGHSDSMAALGVMYSKGEGCSKSKEMALKWLKKASDSGSVYGTGMLTHYYYVTKLYSKAIETAQRLCDLKDSIEDIASKSGGLSCLIAKGLATSYYIYAQCLRYGHGINKSDSEAAVWYEKAKRADQNVVFELHKAMMQGRL